MALIPRTLALTGSLALALTGVGASASAATTYTLLLHATRMASQARGSAVVTQLSPAEDKVTIRALDLPRSRSHHRRRHLHGERRGHEAQGHSSARHGRGLRTGSPAGGAD
jgi:hypothetical protein